MGTRPFWLFRGLLIKLLLINLTCHKIEATETTTDSDTCQCGVFLLGSPPLEFSADAKPVLSGLPVAANCSMKDDKVSCATICRQLIQAMSNSHENSPLVQTVVLAATRTLACQRFNDSHKIPLPRTILDSETHTVAKLDESRKSWKFIVGPSSRKETEAEEENVEPTNEEEDINAIGKLSEPKWLGGFYRWCDSHWVYAGVSLQEPLCCMKLLPKKCPSFRKEPDQPEVEPTSETDDESFQSRNGRQPRLIIKKRPEEDLSSEEQDQDLQPIDENSSTTSSESSSKIPPTTSSLSDSSAETEGPFGNASSEIIHVFDNMDIANPPNKRKPLNSTVLAEAFQFVGALMRSLGFGEVADGISHVLPHSTASELLERVDVGGWVGTYQDKYVLWSREFNLGYCYVEYSLYNIASEGIVGTTSNLIGRLFKTNQQPPPMVNNNHMNNFISPMSSMADGFKAAFHGHPVMPGNRRVRRSDPSVSVSRSYTSISGTKNRARVSRKNAQVQNPIITPSEKPSFAHLASIAKVETAAPFTPLPVPAPATDRKYSHESHPNARHDSMNAQRLNSENIQEPRSSAATPPQAHRQRRPDKAHNQSQPKVKSSAKDASAGQLMNLASVLMQTAMGGSEVDKVSLLMQNALPLVSQVATSPMIQGMVSNLVTSFLTPPRAPPANGQGPAGQGPTGPTGSSSTMSNNISPPSGPARKPIREPVESNEINEMPATASNHRPSLTSGPAASLLSTLAGAAGAAGQGGNPEGGGSNGMTNMLMQIVQTYLKHYFSNLDSRPPPKQPQRDQAVTSKPPKATSTSSSSPSSSSNQNLNNKDDKLPSGGEGTGSTGGDIVAMISEVAKPFFISYFGVVPDVPGFGQLSISERRDRPGSSKDSSVYLTSDPDPGTGITDLVFGAPNLPETGSAVFDFGNRVAYAFSRANDPLQGLYCFKQYAVNKMWDYFRVGVRALFK